jgi:DEAD/DEAH box helicase domain-containing protein
MNDNFSAIQNLIDLFRDGSYSELITSYWEKPEKMPDLVEFPQHLPLILAGYLRAGGLEKLYRHQALGFQMASAGKNVVVSTGTSSGKTLCYSLPIYAQILTHPASTALLLFPTKALTEDQYKKIQDFSQFLRRELKLDDSPIKAGIYDGDTSSANRTAIRKVSNIILTNPDMLHLGILPHHTAWSHFLANLRFIVLDEVHIYRGVFGSHVANVIRRLKRILKFYGASPQFILSSATIQNPGELAEKLVEEPFSVISQDGSYQPQRTYFFLNPPVINEDLGLRRGLIDQSLEIEKEALSSGIQSLVFARSRRAVEIALRRLRESHAAENPPEIQGYRSGFLPAERRAIESGLREGAVSAVISTNAMELGIDMGGVDAVILMGYPGSIASFLQQSGRAGRRQRPSISMLIASSAPVDQYIIRHPDFVQGKNPEKALLDPDNPLLLLNHLRCALFELPFESGEAFGKLEWMQVKMYLDILKSLSQAVERDHQYLWMSDQYPANSISLRNIGGQAFQLRLNRPDGRSALIGEVDYASAPKIVHPQAVYFHNGESYLVRTMDYEKSLVELETFQDDYFTEPRVNTQVEIIESMREDIRSPYEKLLAEITVTEEVIGYRKIDWQTHEILNQCELELPKNELRTVGLCLKLSEDTVKALRSDANWTNDPNQYGREWPRIRQRILERDQYRCQICGSHNNSALLHVHHKIPFRNFQNIEEANRTDNLITLCPNCHKLAEQNVRIRSGLGGFSYLFAQIAPLYLMCDQFDIGDFVDPQSKFNTGLPMLVIYDRFPGGIGLAAELFNSAEEVMRNCREVIESCACKDGCPACVGPAGENGVGGKEAALQIILKLLSTA